MASLKQLQLRHTQAVKRVEKFSDKKDELKGTLQEAQEGGKATVKILERIEKNREKLEEALGSVEKYCSEIAAMGEAASAEAAPEVESSETKTPAPEAPVEEAMHECGLPVTMTQLLDQWLQGREGWSHDDWLGLLGQLDSAGFGAYTERQSDIGGYLESHRA